MRAYGARLVAWAALALWLLPGSALAYSDPGRFGEPIADGGGGGRWFTGSPADGYTCDVCHSGASAAPVRVDGLPIDGYIPGATYEIVVRWPQGLPSVSLLAELTTDAGQPAGRIALPGPDALVPAELCEPKAAGIPGFLLVDTGSPRQVVGAADCGATQVRMQWTAPASNVGRVWFSGGVVQGNDEDDVEGDAVVLLTRPIAASGSQAQVARVEGEGCQVAALPEGGSAALWLVALWLPWLRRYFTRRKISRNSSGPT